MTTIDVVVTSPVNVPGLDAEIRAELGSIVDGIRVTDGINVTVFLLHVPTEAQDKTVRRIVNQHDPFKLTPEQAKHAARGEKLTVMREQTGKADLELSNFKSESAVIQILAEKVAWLEQELRALKGV